MSDSSSLIDHGVRAIEEPQLITFMSTPNTRPISENLILKIVLKRNIEYTK